MPKTKVTPRARHPDRTQQFLDAIQTALNTFEDEISSLTEEICGKAYRNYVTAYREALVPIWNLARFASIRTVMETVADKDMKEITIMAERLKPASPRPKVLPQKAKIPDLKSITDAMLQKFPGKSLPESSICEKIGDVFSNLSTAQKAYSEAAQGLAKLSTLLTPQQYTLLLTATMTPAIQLVVPGQLISLLSKPPPPQPESSTAAGRLEIMNFTKMQVLPDPDSDALTNCDDNSATRVLAAAIYCQLERHYFDETRSRIDVATLFHCNTSQLSKAVMGVNYKSGPITINQRRQAREQPKALKQILQKQKHPTQKMLPNRTQKNQLYQKKTHYQAPAVAAFSLLVYSEGFQNCSFFFFLNHYTNARLYYLYKVIV